MRVRTTRSRFCNVWVAGLAVVLVHTRYTAEDSAVSATPQAKQILEASGVKGGLIVHIGCGGGTLTAALRANENYVVHGLDTDMRAVREAREHIRSLGLYGPVSVEHFVGKRLPYADNMVNLVVAETPGVVTTEEVMRVLAPGGTMCRREDGVWTRISKSHPGNTDEWTHFLYDASGNAVAHDDVVGPPRHAQWIAEPRHTRSHEHVPSINALVSADGRIFYVADEGRIASVRQSPKWALVARDAYNGILLWKRSFRPWFPHLFNWGQTPQELQRRLIAIGDRVFVTLGLNAPLSAVDAATGEILKVYEDTRGTEEILHHEGIILVVVREVTDERVTELERLSLSAKEKESPLFARETAQPLIERFRSVENKAEKAILALSANTGDLLWKKVGMETEGLRPLTLCASGRRVFYQKGREVVCLDLRTGHKLWSVSSAPLHVVCDGSVICADDQTVRAFSASTGESMWSQPASLTQIRDVFVINGSLWLGGFKPCEGTRGPSWGPYFLTQRDLATGKMLMHIEPENPGHHHRCWRNKATDRYVLAGRRGVEFIDLQNGDVLWNSWVRGVCKYGVMPCNGLLYAPPHACACYVAAKLTGFYALAPEAASTSSLNPSDVGRFERGPAYSEGIVAGQSLPSDQDWPTYRHDAQRSGSTQCSVSTTLRHSWHADVGGKLTSPTVAGGNVFVASVEEHKVCGLDAASGRELWDFTTGARVDSPPTLYTNRVVFGCRDGYVYSLRASDGILVWRLRAARDERRIVASGQLESASPVNGSVLVQDGVAYLTAGRSSYLDGGIDLCRVESETGNLLSRTSVYSPDPETGRQPRQYGPAYMPGALGEILTGDDQYIYLRDMVFDEWGRSQPKGNPHLLTLTGFLDDSWAHRSYWIFGTRCSISTGCSGQEKGLVYGRLLVFDESVIYGYGRAKVHWSNQLQDAGYRLFALKRNEKTAQWTKPITIQVRAMVLADKVLFLAGPPAEGGDGPAEPNGGPRALLMAVSASDGKELAKWQLDCSPVFDGMAAANGRLYLSMEGGQVLCMAGD